MASKERIRKKKTKAPSPAVSRKRKESLKTEVIKKDVEDDVEDPQGSQVSVRSATDDNIKDNTTEDQENELNEGRESITPTPQHSSASPRPSSQETRKKKKDHVDQKLGKERTQSPSQTLSPKDGKRQRAPSPLQRRNNVEPLNEQKGTMGSAVSLRSNVSKTSKEAWVEKEDEDEKGNKKRKGQGHTKGHVQFSLSRDNKVTPGERPSSSSTKLRTRPASNTTSAGQEARENQQNNELGLTGVKVDVEEDSPEKHAYIPYLYARNCIAKIMEDMRAMKGNHVVIVEKIQEQYTSIESETQEQFNMFVICMKEEYATKRKAFRSVIDVHRVELDKKEHYWNEMLTSLAERNNRLLREKKMLLVHSKTEIERMEREKADMTKDLTDKMDKMTVAPVPGWEEEKKVLCDQLESEKATVSRLQEELSVKVDTPTVEKVETATVETRESAAAGAGGVGAGTGVGAAGSVVAVGAIAASKENERQMEKERREMEEERQGLREERTELETEREEFGEERTKWLMEIGGLQAQLADKEVNGSEWKVKHDVIKSRLDDAANLQSKHEALEAQYAALALLVKDSDTSEAVQDHLQKTAEEKTMMTTEKAGLQTDILKWEKDFEKKNARKPTEDDKSDSVREMYTSHGELDFMVTSLQKKENTLKQIEGGTVPDPPIVGYKPINTTEPEVVTVQVKVPDPTIVKELESSQQTLIVTRTEVTTLSQQISDLRTEISQQNGELSKQRISVGELDAQIATLKAGGSMGTGAMMMPIPGKGPSDEELDALKKENRALRRDMKKMIKQYERLAARQNVGEGGDQTEEINEMGEALSNLDNKVADLESENEALKEERTILKERVRTITETITITHMNESKTNNAEKDKKIDDLLKELEKLRGENSELSDLRVENTGMQKDMKKMIKTHAKTKARVEELEGAEKAVKLLEVVAMLVHEVHSEVPEAGSKISSRLADVQPTVDQSKQLLDGKQAAYQQWVDKYTQTNGKSPGKGERDTVGEKAHGEWEAAKRNYQMKHLHMSALQLIKTGDVSSAVGDKGDSMAGKAEIEITNLEKALTSADNKIIDLEAENKNVKDERDRHMEKAKELEEEMETLKQQMAMNATLMADSQSSAELTEQLGELQKKSDSFESELMQERMSHVNTRDELETLRKQLEVMKEELDNEKQGVEARVEGLRASIEAQVGAKEEELASVRARNEELEAEHLSKLPPDTAKEIKLLQDKLKQLEKDKSSTKTSSATLTAEIADLTSKLGVASKNLETTRAANRELETKMKASRGDKEKETKRVSRHMEEKQQKASSEDKTRISMLVKRVKELEAQAGKAGAIVPVPMGGGDKGSDGGQVHMLRREMKDKDARIKQLEKDLRSGGGGAAVGAAAAGKGGKQEKILKDMEKKLNYQMDKATKLGEGLKAADDDNKALAKELDEKTKSLSKVSLELKALGMAAKEGVEAAGKVKELEKENKRLDAENIVLTKNYESERVLRKKYYNMVEDMKGKIRVYARARPLSKSELDRGNKSVLNSLDEYSLSVAATRGLKEFQYDQVFMPEATQEKIFEDTNALIQSAVDGYNVCIFAYGQTGSGKTFTMIGDRAQNYPGIAPRAFERIFEMAEELKSKFTIKVETYMMELYNEKLIDLFAKPASGDDNRYDQEKLEIKKDKKGMVVIQGAMVKSARNAKELYALFDEGSSNRHTASTKMNDESSRSHLVIGITLESTNRNTGNVTTGKLSLVDLAGSERVGKTGAGAEQLKEAMSINKSLSALGDVISALSSEQQFIPYRNNKLTMLMQDSLGGNAKTLMFVNISPADYNMDESVISLTYASRVKLITNDASKNADNKEINRLKNLIAKMKKGEQVDEEEV